MNISSGHKYTMSNDSFNKHEHLITLTSLYITSLNFEENMLGESHELSLKL